MSEVLRFRVARGIGRGTLGDAGVPLFPEAVPPGNLFYQQQGPYPTPESVVEAAAAWIADPVRFVDPERPDSPRDPSNPDRPALAALVLTVLRDLDVWLVKRQNEPLAQDLIAEAARLCQAYLGLTGDALKRLAVLVADPSWHTMVDLMRRSLCAVLTVAAQADDIASEYDSRRGSRLHRLLHVAWLVEFVADPAAPEPLIPAVFRRLLTRRIVMPNPPFPIVLAGNAAARRRLELLRRAGVADLWVVRDEWACYQPGEIANIENVLHGELKKREFERTDETEVTETVTDQTTTTDQRDAQFTDRFQVNDEATHEASLAVKLDAQVDTHGQYGPTAVDTHVGGSLDWSMQESSRHASQVAKESVDRTVHTVEQQVRRERTRRTLTRVRDLTTHEINNQVKPAGHVVGVYRWVDKIQRMQLFRYPNRYLLEFQVPEPGAYSRWLNRPPPAPSISTPKPPPFTNDGKPLADDAKNALRPADVAADLERYVALFRVTNLEAEPDPIVYVSAAADLSQEDPNKGKAAVVTYFDVPAKSSRIELAVPDGYVAVEATASAVAMPIHAIWADFPAKWSGDGWAWRDGWHSIQADFAIGGHHVLLSNSIASVEPSTDVPIPEFPDIRLGRSGSTVLPGITGKVTAAATVSGAYEASVSVGMKCVRTGKRHTEWVLDCWTKVHDAWQAWQEEYDAQVRQVEFEASQRGPTGPSPARAQQMIREELKRQLIEQLLGRPFTGLPAMTHPDKAQPPTEDPPFTNLDTALTTAPLIQFLEQVFEWEKLTYVLYPYYWADAAEQWEDLHGIDGPDPAWVDFLRSGSARVVLSVRPGYECAVTTWLEFGLPWDKGPAPVPGQDDYLSTADELRALNSAPDDGIPGDTWEVRLPTTLVWLDPDPNLPKWNTAMRLDDPPAHAGLCGCPPEN